MSRCLKWVAVKDGEPILCGVRAIPKISPFRLVLDNYTGVDPKKISKLLLCGWGSLPGQPSHLDSLGPYRNTWAAIGIPGQLGAKLGAKLGATVTSRAGTHPWTLRAGGKAGGKAGGNGLGTTVTSRAGTHPWTPGWGQQAGDNRLGTTGWGQR